MTAILQMGMALMMNSVTAIHTPCLPVSLQINIQQQQQRLHVIHGWKNGSYPNVGIDST